MYQKKKRFVETSEMAEAFYFMIFVTGGKSPNI
jgi:hypothetical protein